MSSSITSSTNSAKLHRNSCYTDDNLKSVVLLNILIHIITSLKEHYSKHYQNPSHENIGEREGGGEKKKEGKSGAFIGLDPTDNFQWNDTVVYAKQLVNLACLLLTLLGGLGVGMGTDQFFSAQTWLLELGTPELAREPDC